MKIKSIKINSYGNLKNKEIDFENINIIYGQNESGKSTLLNFIKNILYGISKNKNGRDISDYEKYYPWEGENFSGKIKYELDNNETFEIYRDFNKRKPEIYNDKLQEVSDKFKVDKKQGVQIFSDQTGIDEETFISTAFAMQKEVNLDNNIQSNLLQKVANIAESGEDDVSYKKALTNLNSMLLSEVGTNNSKDRPINIAIENIEKYSSKLNEKEKVKENRFYIENRINELKEKIKEKSDKDIILEKIKKILDKSKIEKEKIKIKEDIIKENANKIEKLKNEKNKLDSVVNKKDSNFKEKTKIIDIILIILLIIINVLNIIFIKNKIVNVLILSLIPIYFVYIIIKIKKINHKKSGNDNENINMLDAKIEILEKSNEETKKEIEKIENGISEYVNLEKQKIIKECDCNIDNLFNDNLDLIIEENKKELNEYNLQLHKLEIEIDNINPILEEILNLEEMLEIEKENLYNLEKKAKEFSITKELLEESYVQMKNNVTPKFNQSLSENVYKILNGKYKSIVINNGIVVELEDGRYVNAENLSIGTIEQIYLSLRLSVMKELSNEKLPIMLDETFAYYDNDRLKSSLEFLSKCNNQILIFTCTNREKEILDLMNIKYNYIEM